MEDLERVLVRLIGVDGVRSILNVYLVGSRLFGTARRSSDYDLIIVCEGPAGGAQKHTAVRERAAAGRAQRRWGACGGSRTLPRTLSCTYGVSKPTGLNPFSFSCSQGVDAWVIGAAAFQAAVDAHRMLELMCLWLPPANVLRESRAFRVDLNLDVLRTATLDTVARDWAMAEKVVSKGEFRRGQKIAVHALRLLLFATQVATSGRVVTFDAARRWAWDEAAGTLTWPECAALYGPELDAAKAALAEATGHR